MANVRPVGYAVVGLGWFAQSAILPAFRHSKKGKLVAVVSGDKSKATRVAKKFSASFAYSSHTRALPSRPQMRAGMCCAKNRWLTRCTSAIGCWKRAVLPVSA